MARKMRKFSAGGAQGKYDRRMVDIKKDFEKDSAGKSGKALEVLAAKRAQRTADAEDDRAKRTGADRTATRAAEKAAEANLTKTRKFGADKPVAKAEPAKASTPEPAKASEPEKAKPQSFGAAFKEARARLGAGKTFTYNGKSFTTNVGGEGRKPAQKAAARTDADAAASSSNTKKDADTSTAKPGKFSANPSLAAGLRTAINNAPAKDVSVKTETPKAAPAAKRYETPAEAKARVAKLTGGPKRLEKLGDMLGMGSVDNAKSRAKLLAAREKEKALNAARAKGSKPFASGTDTGAFFTYGKAAAQKNAANKANGGKIMKYAKGGSTPPQPTPAERKADAKFRESIKKEKVTPEQAAAIGRGNRSERRYAAGGVTKEMPSSNAMGSMGMAKGGKTKVKAKGKGNPFAATKFGAAMVKKSADTKGRAMPKFAKGGSIDGCAQRGKTKTKRVTMACGGMAKGRK